MPEDGVMPQGDVVNATWKNQKGRLELAKKQAAEARGRGDYASAHSGMLSEYITALSGDPAEGRHPVKFFLLALWHAFCMSWRLEKLNHNQLDVWLSFTLKLRAKMPAFKSVLNKTLLGAITREMELTAMFGKPHQLALANMTFAEVARVTNFLPNENAAIVKRSIATAVGLEQQIREETDQPQGLRQLVRVLRKAGELYIALGDPRQGKAYLNYALVLALGEANAPDQIPKIKAILAKI